MRQRIPHFFCLVPVILPLGLFVSIALLNWDYVEKFFQPLNAPAADKWLGPKMLLGATVTGIASCGFVYVMCRNFGNGTKGPSGFGDWFQVIMPGFIAFILMMAAIFVVILGPAALTMIEQMQT